MMSTIAAKTTNNYLRGVGGSRYCRRLCLFRQTAGKSTSSVTTGSGSSAVYSSSSDSSSNSDGYHSSLLLSGLQQNEIYRSSSSNSKAIRRWYSSTITKYDNKTGKEHHTFFQEQMLELDREQKQFGQSDDDDDEKDGDNDGDSNQVNNGVGVGVGVDTNKDDKGDYNKNTAASSSLSSSTVGLEEQLNDWREEQTQVLGEKLVDHEDGGSDIPTNNSNDNANNDDDDDMEMEMEIKREEREDRYEFSPEDKAAWGKPPPEQDSMRKILEKVAMEREKELEYTKSSSLSPSPSASSPPSQSPSTDNANNRDSSSNSSSTAQHHEAFSHVSEDGAGVHMVDVGRKAVTPRMAHARSEVWLPSCVLEAFLPNSPNSNSSPYELVGPKGPIFATAKIAGIMAAKKTSDLIPLCHPLPLDQVQVDIRLKDDATATTTTSGNNNGGGIVVIDCVCRVTHKTGVEMEALTGAMVAALTIYDMTKAVSHNIRIKETRLIGKSGGKRTVLDGIEE